MVSQILILKTFLFLEVIIIIHCLNNELAIPLVNTVLKGKNSIRYLGPVIWNSIPLNIRCIDNINIFKSKIRQWKPESCKCRLCL